MFKMQKIEAKVLHKSKNVFRSKLSNYTRVVLVNILTLSVCIELIKMLQLFSCDRNVSYFSTSHTDQWKIVWQICNGLSFHLSLISHPSFRRIFFANLLFLLKLWHYRKLNKVLWFKKRVNMKHRKCWCKNVRQEYFFEQE